MNYHHLHYFWVVAREASVTRAAAQLRVSPSTVSAQVKALEDALGERLLERRGRGLALTPAGERALRGADEVFRRGQELVESVRGVADDARLAIGVASALPRLEVARLLAPLFAEEGVRVRVTTDEPARLFGALTTWAIDAMIVDGAWAEVAPIRCHAATLSVTTYALFGARRGAGAIRRSFPRSMEGRPILLPSATTAIARAVRAYFADHGVEPDWRGEIDDSATLKAVASETGAAFVAPHELATDLRAHYDVVPIAELPDLRTTTTIVTLERRVKHPLVKKLCAAATR